ncbi:hypothetical protein GGR51DRAFT_573260 [Nemania sp. FL0031]|nr:hypothetical protein GGR51DRAFT_573260 [Nemania sp. FL0031]
MANQTITQTTLSFSDDIQTCAIMSSCHSPSKPIVRLPPLTARLAQDTLFASTQEPVVAVSSPTSLIRDTVNSSAAEGTETEKNKTNIAEKQPIRSEHSLTSTSVTKFAQSRPVPVAQVATVIDSPQPKTDNELHHCLAKLGLETSKNFTWADDPDLSPLPTENKSKEDVIQTPIQKGFRGLMSSRWATQEDSSPSYVARGAPKRNLPQHQGNGLSKGVANSRWAARRDPSPTPVIRRQVENDIPQNHGSGTPTTKGLASSRWAPKDRTPADKQGLGNKFMRELSQHRPRNSQHTTNGQASSRPRYQPAVRSSTKPPQPPHVSSYGHPWNNKPSRSSYQAAKEEDKKTKYDDSRWAN